MSQVAGIVIAYDGTGFHGWQVQPDRRTVQGELVRSLERLVPLEGLPPGAGRTDAGVHARAQICTVPYATREQLERMARALPRMVPEDMAILRVGSFPAGFHARHSATGRRYAYRLLRHRDPLRRYDHHVVLGELNGDAMAIATRDLIGEHDYSSFCKASSVEAGRTVCRVRRVELVRDDDVWTLWVEADRFLHNMVRTIMGTLLEIGRGRRPADTIPAILQARRREAAGFLAPAHGLCLEAVEYAELGFLTA